MPPPSVVIVRDLRFGIGQFARLDPVFDLVADETNQRGVFPGIEARESLPRFHQAHPGPPPLGGPESHSHGD